MEQPSLILALVTFEVQQEKGSWSMPLYDCRHERLCSLIILDMPVCLSGFACLQSGCTSCLNLQEWVRNPVERSRLANACLHLIDGLSLPCPVFFFFSFFWAPTLGCNYLQERNLSDLFLRLTFKRRVVYGDRERRTAMTHRAAADPLSARKHVWRRKSVFKEKQTSICVCVCERVCVYRNVTVRYGRGDTSVVFPEGPQFVPFPLWRKNSWETRACFLFFYSPPLTLPSLLSVYKHVRQGVPGHLLFICGR